MNQKIMLLNVTRTKEDNVKKYCKIEFAFWQENLRANSTNMKGFTINSMFYDRDVFDKIPNDWCGKLITATLKDIPDKFNPLNKKTKILSLEYENNSIDLL